MQIKPLLLVCALSSLLCSSCITAAATAATGAVGAAGSGSGLALLGLSSLFRSSAPESAEGLTLTCTAATDSRQTTLSFPKGVESNLSYARTGNKTATVTCVVPEEKDAYSLTFTDNYAGTYVLESTDSTGAVRFSHGSFTLR